MEYSIFERKKVLITVTTYPLPSRSYDELVCTAGILEDGSWIRIYPVPFKVWKSHKYEWVELSLQKRLEDFRPESHKPEHPDLSDLVILEKLDTKNYWEKRKAFCLKSVFNSMNELIDLSRKPSYKSLAVFKPEKFLDFIIESDNQDWKPEWIERLLQLDLFDKSETKRTPVKKVPYKFKYKFLTTDNTTHILMIEDWEIGALYWNCLEKSNYDEKIALEKVKEKYWNKFMNKHDIYLFLGTTKEWQMRNSKNPFVIIGIFYPLINPNKNQQILF